MIKSMFISKCSTYLPDHASIDTCLLVTLSNDTCFDFQSLSLDDLEKIYNVISNVIDTEAYV